MKKNVLITGGLGLIGSNLSIKLHKSGFKVTIIDNLSSGSLENIPKIVRKQIKIFKSDILNYTLVEKLIKKNYIVFHLAAFVGVKNILLNKISSIETNSIGTSKILELCSKYKKKVILASTSEVFGMNVKRSLSETDKFFLGNAQTFRWSYAASKIIDEYLATAYMDEKKLDVLIVRFFNTVGPKQKSFYGMVMPRFIQAATSGKDIIVYGNGKQTRTFLHVDDATDALIELLKRKHFKDIVHIGGTQNISIYNLAKKIKKITKSNSAIKKVDYSYSYSKSKKFHKIYQDIPKRHPSINKLNKIIKFKPKFSLDEIINDVAKSYNK